MYKERVIREKKFDYFIEDNWDIVAHLSGRNMRTQIHWIYNIFDRSRNYENKYPYLKQSLERIIDLNNIPV